MTGKIDRTIERTYFYHVDDEPPDVCPRCEQPLVEDTFPLVPYRAYGEPGRKRPKRKRRRRW